MESIAFNTGNFLKPNTELLKEKESLKGKDFSSILKSVNNPDKDKRSTVNSKERKSRFLEDSVEQEEIKDSSNKDDTVSGVEAYPLYFIHALVSMRDDNVPTDHTEDAGEAEITNVGAMGETLIAHELVVENESEEYETVNLEDFVEDIQIADKQEPLSQELNEESAITPNEYKLELTNNSPLKELQAKKAHDILEGEVSKENEIELNNMEVSFEDGDISDFTQENNSSTFKNVEEHLDIEIDREQDEIKVQDESFSIMDRNEIRFKTEVSTELEVKEIIEPKEVVEQIVEKFQIDLSQSKSEIKVKLKPEILGDMTMSIEVLKEAVVAKVMVDNHRTKEIIEGNLIQLKEGIKDRGLEIKTFEVFVGNNSDFDKHNPNQFYFNQNNKRLKIKPQDYEETINYEESLNDPGPVNLDPYGKSSLNLLA